MLAYPSFKDMSEAISSGTHHDTKLKKIHRYLWGTVYGCWTLDIAGHRYDIPSRYWVTQTTKPVAIVVTMSVSMLHTCQNYPSRLLLNLLNQHSTILPFILRYYKPIFIRMMLFIARRIWKCLQGPESPDFENFPISISFHAEATSELKHEE